MESQFSSSGQAGDFTAEELYRHLRGLNTICVPKSDKSDKYTQMLGGGDGREIAVAGAGQDEDSVGHSVFRGYERVIFRYADANVMMQVIPVLDETQTAILFGPPEQIIFAPDVAWGGGVKRARQRDGVPKQHGILTLSEKNIDAMADIRLEASRRKRAALFRNSTPHLLDGLNDEEALFCMERYEQQARAHGLRTERGFYQWTYLMSASEGRFIQSPDIRHHLRGENPDKRLDEMIGFMANVAMTGHELEFARNRRRRGPGCSRCGGKISFTCRSGLDRWSAWNCTWRGIACLRRLRTLPNVQQKPLGNVRGRAR